MRSGLVRIFLRSWLPAFLLTWLLIGLFATALFVYTYYADLSYKHLTANTLLRLLGWQMTEYLLRSTHMPAFIAAAALGYYLGKYWYKLPLKLFRTSLFIPAVLSFAMLMLNARVQPFVSLRSKTLLYNIIVKSPDKPLPEVAPSLFDSYSRFSSTSRLIEQTDSLTTQINTDRQQLISYLHDNSTPSQLRANYYIYKVPETGISWHDVYTTKGEGTPILPSGEETGPTILSMVRQIKDTQFLLDQHTHELWQRHLLPLFLLLWHAIGFLIGAINYRLSPLLMFPMLLLLYGAVEWLTHFLAIDGQDNIVDRFLPLGLLALAATILYCVAPGILATGKKDRRLPMVMFGKRRTGK
ncbi:hypothetical protein KTO58_22905 [Chitinophaga pendula]|uniref:hypothetical protein n=1 Tax=Chitinophaga TaxID=79328 RepID=UPI000BAEFEC8|nr:MULTISPECIES: hypothetical protein [Chitinophaga]ASZ10536.1 hypothetical protein CK934_05870 [Chitinophaga sp. MD30]UCJ06491.1 hypothetical protein KTO58_22905 [Chitinophaga pendula]